MKIIVIGAGILGISTAYFLQKHGVEVTVLDKEALPARGASYGNGGYFQSSVPDPWNAPGIFSTFLSAWKNSLTGKGDQSAFSAPTSSLPGFASWGLDFLSNANEKTFLDSLIKNRNLAQYTRSVLDDLNVAEALSYDQSQSGSLIIFRDQTSMDDYAAIANLTLGHGTNLSLLNRDELLQVEPSLIEAADELTGAVLFPDDHGGNSRIYCEQLCELTRARGMAYRFGVSVSQIASRNSHVKVRLDDGEELIADAAVIAAGTWSRQLGRCAGVRVPVAPAKGYSLSIPMGNWNNRPRHIIADMGTHAGVNPLGDTLRLAGTAEFCGHHNTGINEARVDYLIGLVRELFPSFVDTIDRKTIDPWGGFRPLSTDGIPYIGKTRVSNIYLNTGHGGLGWTQGAGSGKALADEIAGVPLEFDLTDYAALRIR